LQDNALLVNFLTNSGLAAETSWSPSGKFLVVWSNRAAGSSAAGGKVEVVVFQTSYGASSEVVAMDKIWSMFEFNHVYDEHVQFVVWSGLGGGNILSIGDSSGKVIMISFDENSDVGGYTGPLNTKMFKTHEQKQAPLEQGWSDGKGDLGAKAVGLHVQTINVYAQANAQAGANSGSNDQTPQAPKARSAKASAAYASSASSSYGTPTCCAVGKTRMIVGTSRGSVCVFDIVNGGDSRFERTPLMHVPRAHKARVSACSICPAEYVRAKRAQRTAQRDQRGYQGKAIKQGRQGFGRSGLQEGLAQQKSDPKRPSRLRQNRVPGGACTYPPPPTNSSFVLASLAGTAPPPPPRAQGAASPAASRAFSRSPTSWNSCA
jgi:hypothetical protein